MGVVKQFLAKLESGLADLTLNYVRVIKSQPPSILEIECDTVARYEHLKKYGRKKVSYMFP